MVRSHDVDPEVVLSQQGCHHCPTERGDHREHGDDRGPRTRRLHPIDDWSMPYPGRLVHGVHRGVAAKTVNKHRPATLKLSTYGYDR